MCCKSWKTFLPFFVTFFAGMLATVGVQSVKNSCAVEPQSKSLQILSQPKASYTEMARENQTQGSVTLQVTFQDNGKIGNIKILKSLPDGLTEQALEAARQIKFEPARQKGQAVAVTKQVQYTFALY